MPFVQNDPTIVNNTKPDAKKRYGISLPFRANKNGEVALSSGIQNDEEEIILAIISDENNNAFLQNQGIGSDQIFRANGSQIESTLTARLIAVFDSFERQNRFILHRDSVQVLKTGIMLEVRFRYFNIENSEEREYSKQFV